MSCVVRDMCADTVRAASRHLSGLVPAEPAWSPVELFGTGALIAYGVNRAEFDRRGRVDLGPLLSSDHLELLMSLPMGWPVPVSVLSHSERGVLRRIPAGAVRIAAGSARRLAVPPVRVDLAIVPASRWRSGLERAGRFAPFTARMLWLPRSPSDVGVMVGASRRFGVGVLVGPAERAEVLVPPAPYVRRRFTAAGWLFTEQVYALVR